MRRVLAEVLETNQSPADPDDVRDLPWRKVRCLVKVLSNVPEQYQLPADVKDSTLTIEREAIFPWEYEPGSKVILSPEESKSIVQREARVPQTGSLKGRVITNRTDINGDGFTERVVENSFIRVVIGPKFGARIWEVWNKRRNENLLSRTEEFYGEFVDLGGHTDHITEQDNQGEFWKSEFTEKEITNDQDGCRITYEFRSEKSKGLTVVKEIVVPVDCPVVRSRITFKYSGAEQPPADGKPDEFELSYWSRWGFWIGGDAADNNAAVVPTGSGMKVVHHERSWHVPRYWDISAPYLLVRNTDSGSSAALLIDHDQLKYSKVYRGHKIITHETQANTVKIPKGGEHSFTQVLVVADSVSTDQKKLAITALGPEQDGETPVFVLATAAVSESAVLVCEPSSLPVETSCVEYAGAVKVCQGTAWIKSLSIPETFDTLKMNGSIFTLCSGGEL
jgi:hypothetical protein